MQVFSLNTKNYNVSLIKARDEDLAPLNPQNRTPYFYDPKFTMFWELMDTIDIHGYLKAAMSVVGRSAVGAGWTLKKHEDYENLAKVLHKRRLIDFYNMIDRPWDNIKDYFGMNYKIMLGIMYLRYFGQCSYHIIRDGFGKPIGLDFMYGYVKPNIDQSGNFKSPAFIQFPDNSIDYMVAYDDPRDVVFITTPDWRGYPTGGSDIESTTTFSLPLDIYLQTAAREYVRNRSKPEAFYILSPDISDTAFDEFVIMLEQKYAGASNVGKNPIVVQGELEIKELKQLPADLPYNESREKTREETLAAAGVPGAKLGLSSSVSNANFKEARREFHETSMVPLFKFIAEGFYAQIHVREFGIKGWTFEFNNPDFLTAVERATVDMRYFSIGAKNPNEIRYDSLGLESRGEKGDLFVDELEEANAPSNTPLNNPDGEPGSPPEGREDEPDSPGNVGEPTLDDQDPPRGDQHDEESLMGELRKFKKFTYKRFRDGRRIRPFEFKLIPHSIGEQLNKLVAAADDTGDLDEIFEDLI